MAIIPHFDNRGLLPPGDYAVTLQQLRDSVLVKGGGEENWDSGWRHHLVDQAEVLVKQLWDVGIEDIFLDGSFVEDKAHPNDIDGYFVSDLYEFASGALERRLNALDLYKVWTWDPASRRAYRNYAESSSPCGIVTVSSSIRTLDSRPVSVIGSETNCSFPQPFASSALRMSKRA